MTVLAGPNHDDAFGDPDPLRLSFCPACGYSLDVLPIASRCPECGDAYDGTRPVILLRGWFPPVVARVMWTAFTAIVALLVAFGVRFGFRSGPVATSLVTVVAIVVGLRLAFAIYGSWPNPLIYWVTPVGLGFQWTVARGSVLHRAAQGANLVFSVGSFVVCGESIVEVFGVGRTAALVVGGVLVVTAAVTYTTLWLIQGRRPAIWRSRQSVLLGRDPSLVPWGELSTVRLTPRPNGRYRLYARRRRPVPAVVARGDVELSPAAAAALTDRIATWRAALPESTARRR